MALTRSAPRPFVAAAASLAAVLAILVTGCSARPTVSQWAQASGIVGLDNTVFSDVNGALGAKRAHKPASLITTICDALANDASQAYDSVLPSPDQGLTNLLSTAYVDLQNGGQDCSTSVGGANAAASAHAYREINAGTALLREATARLRSVGIQ